MTAEQKKIVERCCGMLKRSLTDIKRVVIHLANDGEKDTVYYEVHGKMMVGEPK